MTGDFFGELAAPRRHTRPLQEALAVNERTRCRLQPFGREVPEHRHWARAARLLSYGFAAIDEARGPGLSPKYMHLEATAQKLLDRALLRRRTRLGTPAKPIPLPVISAIGVRPAWLPYRREYIEFGPVPVVALKPAATARFVGKPEHGMQITGGVLAAYVECWHRMPPKLSAQG